MLGDLRTGAFRVYGERQSKKRGVKLCQYSSNSGKPDCRGWKSSLYYSCKFYEDLRLSKLKNKLVKNLNEIKLNQRTGRIPVLKAGEVCAGAGSLLHALWLVLVSASVLGWFPWSQVLPGAGTRGPTFRQEASSLAWINPIRPLEMLDGCESNLNHRVVASWWKIAPQRKICMFWGNNLDTQPIKVHTQLCVEQMLKKVNSVQMQRWENPFTKRIKIIF